MAWSFRTESLCLPRSLLPSFFLFPSMTSFDINIRYIASIAYCHMELGGIPLPCEREGSRQGSTGCIFMSSPLFFTPPLLFSSIILFNVFMYFIEFTKVDCVVSRVYGSHDSTIPTSLDLSRSANR